MQLPFHVLGDKADLIACLTDRGGCRVYSLKADDIRRTSQDYLVWERMSSELLQPIASAGGSFMQRPRSEWKRYKLEGLQFGALTAKVLPLLGVMWPCR